MVVELGVDLDTCFVACYLHRFVILSRFILSSFLKHIPFASPWAWTPHTSPPFYSISPYFVYSLGNSFPASNHLTSYFFPYSTYHSSSLTQWIKGIAHPYSFRGELNRALVG